MEAQGCNAELLSFTEWCRVLRIAAVQKHSSVYFGQDMLEVYTKATCTLRLTIFPPQRNLSSLYLSTAGLACLFFPSRLATCRACRRPQLYPSALIISSLSSA
jgi:hypothetical protein